MSELHEKLIRVQREHEEDILGLRSSPNDVQRHEQQLKRLQLSHDENLKRSHRELRDHHENVLKEREEMYETEMKRLSHAKILKERRVIYRYEKHHEDAFRECQEEYKSEMNQLELAHTDNLERQHLELQQSHEIKTSLLNSLRAQHLTQFESQLLKHKSELHEMRARHHEHENSRLVNQRKSMDKLRKSHAQHIDLVHQHESNLHRKLSNLQRELDLHRLSNQHLESMSSTHLSQIQFHEKATRNMKEEHQDAMKRVFRVVRAEMYEEYEQHISKTREKLFQSKELLMAERHRHTESIVSNLKNYKDEILGQSREELCLYELKCQEEIADARSPDWSLVVDAHEIKIEEDQERYQNDLEDTRRSHEDHLAEVHRTHKNKLSHVRNELIGANRTHKSYLSEFRNELKVQRRRFQNQLSRLEKDKEQVNEFLTGLLHEKYGSDDDVHSSRVDASQSNIYRTSSSMFPAHAAGSRLQHRSQQRALPSHSFNDLRRRSKHLTSAGMFPSSSDMDDEEEEENYNNNGGEVTVLSDN